MTQPNIFDTEELYNSVVLDGVKSPGQVTLSGHDSNVTWDVKSGPGIAGASTQLMGKPPVAFTATFYLVKDVAQGTDDISAWDAFQRVIDSSVDGPKPRGLTIYHPDLARNRITLVVKSSVGGMTYDGKGGAYVVVKFQQYAPPRKSGGPVVALAPVHRSPNGALHDENDGYAAQLNALVEQYKVTPSG